MYVCTVQATSNLQIWVEFIVHICQVRHEGDPEAALVQFSSPAEATKAHNSTEAVLNNRFIKVFYLRQNDPVVSLEVCVCACV